jgi:hypothetical protein
MIKTEYFALTNETIESPLTPAEIKEIEKTAKEYDKAVAKKESDLAAKEAAKSAIADRLGLTADELKLLLG